MKRIFCFMLLVVLALTANAGGIRTASDLVAFVEAINGGQPVDQWKNEAGEICLEADIDMAKVKKLKPISSFGGVFDGKGFSIVNWKTKDGLIDCLLQGGTVRNLTIAESCSMKAANSGEEYCLGFIVNRNHGLVENCVNKGTIVHKSPYTAQDIYVGGVVGSNRCLVIKCRNYGGISSSCVSSHQQSNPNLSVGGVVGGGYRKTEPKPNVSWCENYGKVTYGGDMPNVNVGGVVGHNYSATVKYCLNRGDVEVSTDKGENPVKDLYVQIGGVCAFSKGDVIGCDNFAEITSSGSHSAVVGGVIAMPHTSMTVVDCANYGKVSLSNERPSSLGGIVGKAGRPVHIAACFNYGDIVYEGYSPDRPSSVGGIIGDIYTKKDYRFAAYVRGCVNYGTVFSGSGGNNYANERAIHTGGIAGRTQGVPAAEVVIRDCANKGKVTAVTGKKSQIVAGAVNTNVFGEYNETYALSAEPLSDGSNIYGKVLAGDGSPVPDVVVSDGVRCVTTGVDGSYSMTSDLSSSRFVFISLPSAYEAPSVNSFPQLFRRIRRHEKAVRADFVLDRRTEPSDEYTVIMIGDPQMRGLGYDNSGESFRDKVIPDIEKLKGDRKNFYAINLGDLVYNWMHGYDDYLDICSGASFPIYNVVGNHDFDQSNLYDIRLATGFYETYVSPTYYSFNIGDVHYVFLNTIMADPMDPKGRAYGYGLTDEQVEWLENDLKYVPKDKTIAVCTHALLFNNSQLYREKRYRNFDAFKSLLAQFPKVYAWGGHSHDNYGCIYDLNGTRMPAVTVARCNGALRTNNVLNNDGTPNGYMVVSVKGGDMKWYYRAVGEDADCQMRLYSPVVTESGYVKAVIWNHTPDFWGTPQWYENGVLVGDMEMVMEKDPAYVELFSGLSGLKGRALSYAEPVEREMFRIKPSAGVRRGEVRVTDNFGVTYVQTVEW